MVVAGAREGAAQLLVRVLEHSDVLVHRSVRRAPRASASTSSTAGWPVCSTSSTSGSAGPGRAARRAPRPARRRALRVRRAGTVARRLLERPARARRSWAHATGAEPRRRDRPATRCRRDGPTARPRPPATSRRRDRTRRRGVGRASIVRSSPPDRAGLLAAGRDRWHRQRQAAQVGAEVGRPACSAASAASSPRSVTPVITSRLSQPTSCAPSMSVSIRSPTTRGRAPADPREGLVEQRPGSGLPGHLRASTGVLGDEVHQGAVARSLARAGSARSGPCCSPPRAGPVRTRSAPSIT